jgi:RNA polymerase sigma-70 factor (ECF subfamily)
MKTGPRTPGAKPLDSEEAAARDAAARDAAATPEAAASPEAAAPTAIDRAFRGTQAGDANAFATWIRLTEGQLRRSLRPFATHVDIEAILQEGFLRVWKLAPDLRLTGPDASLRYAFRIIRNLAISEARRHKRLTPLELEALDRLPEASVNPDPLPDPALRRLILECIERLPRRPREALLARLAGSGLSPDRDLAAGLQMKLNTFLQNIVRARKLVADCLRRHGVTLEGVRT